MFCLGHLRTYAPVADDDHIRRKARTLRLRALTEKPVRFSIQYNVDQDLDELWRFRGELLDIAPDSIALQRKSNSNGLQGRQWRSRYGVINARVSDTLLRARMQAWIDRLKAEWSVD